MQEVRDDQRVREEMRAMAVAEGVPGASTDDPAASLGQNPYVPQLQGSTVYNQNL